eukprot:maker-scaffold1126_size61158-snap-gene-0.12 protein:Tk03417 transcript:maker-scaffold1126_size61158-snap-gene-0.12-mRNA-1 annotation:"serine protease easter precursor"
MDSSENKRTTPGLDLQIRRNFRLLSSLTAFIFSVRRWRRPRTMNNSTHPDIALSLQRSFQACWSSHVIALGFLVLVETLGNALLLSVIWYQQFGRESNRTLLNHLHSHILGYMIASNCFTFPLKILPYLIRGPLPPWLCMVHEVANAYLNTAQMLTGTEGIFVRYLYLVKWKNIGLLADEFFNAYLFILNNMLTLFGVTIAWYGDTLYYPLYFICSGQGIVDIAEKFPNFILMLVPFVTLANCSCYVQILINRRNQNGKDQPQGAPQRIAGFRSTSIVTVKSGSIMAVMMMVSSVPFFALTNDVNLIVQYPIGFLTSLSLPQLVVSIGIPTISYIFNEDMRELHSTLAGSNLHSSRSKMGSGKVRVLISALVIAKVRCQCQTVPTIDGTASPEPCIFPFDYDGFHFDSCTAIGDGSDRVWCSVAVNEFGEHITGQGRWGHCDLLTCEGLWSKGPSQRENTQCRTFAGFRPNRPCVFPFILKDKIYNTCTTDLDENEELWCSTRVDSSGNHVTGEWGYCTCDDNLTGSVLEECPNSERSFISNVPIRGNYIPSLNECGQPLDNRFVTGGKAASVEEFSFAALVGYESFDNHIRFGCGGVLINRRYVLTAAHCVEFDAPKIVRLGELVVGRECDCTPDESRCARRVQDIDIERIITHEAYSRRDSFKNDITLLRLARPVVLSSSVGVVCLPIGAPFKGNLDGNLVTVVGWGRIKYDQPGAFQ